MPECLVCGEENFEEVDGLYFCTMCNTQSQEMRVVAADEEMIAISNKKIYTKKAKIKEKQRNYDMGRPWSVYEAYQIILLRQVEAFIKLGAQSRLKDVVFKIWANYLHKLDIAFSNRAAPCEALQKYDRQREKYRGTTNKPRVKNVLGKRSRKRTSGAARKDAEKQIERDIMNEALQDEEFDEDENPLQQKTASSDDEWSSGEDTKDDKFWSSGRQVLSHKSVYKIKMLTTISVCYLGLMYTNPLVTVADVMRWIRSYQVPYLKAVYVIPEDMKFCLSDWRLFGMGEEPNQETLRSEVGRIAFFLGLDDFPEFPFHLLVNKYVMQLDLPTEIHGYCMNLVHFYQQSFSFRPTQNFKHLPLWEGLAMATVIVTLKMIFNLNDHSERVISECTRSLKDLCQTGEQLFVWTDWVSHQKLRQLMQLMEPNEKIDATALNTNIDAIRYSSALPRYKQYRPLVRQSLQEPFAELAERWKHRKSYDSFLDDGMPDPLRDADDTDERLPQARQNKYLLKKIEQAGKLFRNSTVEHVVHANTFSEDLQTDSSSRVPRNQSQIETESVNGDSNINGSYGNDTTSHFTNIENKSLFNDTIRKIYGARHSFIPLETRNQSDSVCYNWLVSSCAAMIGLAVAQLQEEIAKLEVMLLGDTGGDENLKNFEAKIKRDITNALFKKLSVRKGKK